MLKKLNDEGVLALLEAIFSECTVNDLVIWNQELNALEYRDGVSPGCIDRSQLDTRPWNPVKYFGRLREL